MTIRAAGISVRYRLLTYRGNIYVESGAVDEMYVVEIVAHRAVGAPPSIRMLLLYKYQPAWRIEEIAVVLAIIRWASGA